MARRALPNPVGQLHLPVGDEVVVIRVGETGEHTHALDHDERYGPVPLCRSNVGKQNAKIAKKALPTVPPLYRSNARYVTCYRCIKLLKMNEKG